MDKVEQTKLANKTTGKPPKDTEKPPNDTGKPQNDVEKPQKHTEKPHKDAEKPSKDTKKQQKPIPTTSGVGLGGRIVRRQELRPKLKKKEVVRYVVDCSEMAMSNLDANKMNVAELVCIF